MSAAILATTARTNKMALKDAAEAALALEDSGEFNQDIWTEYYAQCEPTTILKLIEAVQVEPSRTLFEAGWSAAHDAQDVQVEPTMPRAKSFTQVGDSSYFEPKFTADEMREYGGACAAYARNVVQAEPVAQQQPTSPDVREALLFALWHHQGSGSQIGQPIRHALGIGQHDPLTDEQLECAKLVSSALSTPKQTAFGIAAMVDRFLGWPLPKDFYPDCGITFTPLGHPNGWPIGTNLLTATQAKAMFEYVLKAEPEAMP